MGANLKMAGITRGTIFCILGMFPRSQCYLYVKTYIYNHLTFIWVHLRAVSLLLKENEGGLLVGVY